MDILLPVLCILCKLLSVLLDFRRYFPVERISDATQYAAMKRQIQKLFPEFDANALDISIHKAIEAIADNG